MIDTWTWKRGRGGLIERWRNLYTCTSPRVADRQVRDQGMHDSALTFYKARCPHNFCFFKSPMVAIWLTIKGASFTHRAMKIAYCALSAVTRTRSLLFTVDRTCWAQKQYRLVVVIDFPLVTITHPTEWLLLQCDSSFPSSLGLRWKPTKPLICFSGSQYYGRNPEQRFEQLQTRHMFSARRI